MPITPFIGVRISWLMLARKSDFTLEASSAASRDCSKSASTRCRTVMSLTNSLLAWARSQVRC